MRYINSLPFITIIIRCIFKLKICFEAIFKTLRCILKLMARKTTISTYLRLV